MDAAKFLIEFNDLEFEEDLDRGNFGKVSIGYYLGTKVAIKELFYVDDEFMEKYIEREMQTLIQLSHPNIIQLIGLCVTTDVFLITEFVEGGNLASTLADPRVKLPWDLKLTLCIQACRALVYLHEKHNLIHRDLKSSNILIDKSGKEWVAKVCDFGLAREDTNQSDEFKASVAQLYTVVGTSEWMAPEVALGQEYNKAADVFSFGIVIWEVGTRTKPPARSPPLFRLDKDLFQSQLPKDTPDGFWKIIEACTEKYDDQRPTMKKTLEMLEEVFETVKKSTPLSTTGTNNPNIVEKTESKETDNKGTPTTNKKTELGGGESTKKKTNKKDKNKKDKKDKQDKTPNKNTTDQGNDKKDDFISKWEDEALKRATIDENVNTNLINAHNNNVSTDTVRLTKSNGGKISEEVSKKYWNSSAPINVRITIEDKAFSAKEDVKPFIEMDNEATTSVKGMKMFLQEVGKKRRTIGGTSYVSPKSFPMTGPKEFNTTASFKLPSKVKSDKQYELVLEVSIKFHNSLRVGVPIKIKK